MIKWFFYILNYFFFLNSFFSQTNLIQNPSFEEHQSSPKNISEFNKVNLWSKANTSTPDYYCTCEENKSYLTCVPQNAFSNLPAHTGNCYAGIILYQKNRKEYREYIQTEFIKPLIKGHTYLLSFYISEASYTRFKNKNIGILFLKNKWEQNNDLRIENNESIELPLDSKNKEVWQKIQYTYQAQGDEKFLIIGKFETNKGISNKKYIKAPEYLRVPPYYADVAYYFIDDVELTSLTKDSINGISLMPTEDTLTPGNIYNNNLGKNMILKGLYFDVNKSDILPSSKNELDNLLLFLQQNSTYTILISGYTDNQGNEQDNMTLSLLRAKSVANFLIQSGISSNRIQYFGFGSQHPILPNNKEENRAKNRRVEIKIMNKD